MAELKLTQIWIYPIKSLGGISLQSAKVMGKGLQYDRRWMLVDDTGKFMTQRLFPKMALFKLSIEKENLVVSYRDSTIKLELAPSSLSNSSEVTIWNDTVTAFDLGTVYNEWFSDRLEHRCRLVHFPETNARPVDPRYRVNDEHVSLADAYPFLIIGQSSVDDLNSRLTEPVPINRFRPNFVFEGGKPFEEDGWRNFTIGSTRFVGVKLCDRCVLPNVNQDTAEKGVEPLKTLSSYRRDGNKVLFGQNLVTLDESVVSVGEKITPQ